MNRFFVYSALFSVFLPIFAACSGVGGPPSGYANRPEMIIVTFTGKTVYSNTDKDLPHINDIRADLQIEALFSNGGGAVIDSASPEIDLLPAAGAINDSGVLTNSPGEKRFTVVFKTADVNVSSSFAIVVAGPYTGNEEILSLEVKTFPSPLTGRFNFDEYILSVFTEDVLANMGKEITVVGYSGAKLNGIPYIIQPEHYAVNLGAGLEAVSSNTLFNAAGYGATSITVKAILKSKPLVRTSFETPVFVNNVKFQIPGENMCVYGYVQPDSSENAPLQYGVREAPAFSIGSPSTLWVRPDCADAVFTTDSSGDYAINLEYCAVSENGLVFEPLKAPQNADAWAGPVYNGGGGNVCAVSSASQLKAIRNDILQGENRVYVLVENIDLSQSEWDALGNYNGVSGVFQGFCGWFYGNNHTINRLKLSSTRPAALYSGLFGFLYEGRVEKLTVVLEAPDEPLTLAYTSANPLEGEINNSALGALAGRAEKSVIKDVKVCSPQPVPVLQAGGSIGGVCGAVMETTITGSFSNINFVVYEDAAAAPGRNELACVGGLAGSVFNNSVFFKNKAAGSLRYYASNSSVKEFFAGGVAGVVVNSDLIQCAALEGSDIEYFAESANLSALNAVYAGGVAGSAEAAFSKAGVIDQCAALGDITIYAAGSRANVGGIAANIALAVRSSYFRGSISVIDAARFSAGGVAGVFSGRFVEETGYRGVSYCYSSGSIDVSGVEDAAGALESKIAGIAGDAGAFPVVFEKNAAILSHITASGSCFQQVECARIFNGGENCSGGENAASNSMTLTPEAADAGLLRNGESFPLYAFNQASTYEALGWLFGENSVWAHTQDSLPVLGWEVE